MSKIIKLLEVALGISFFSLTMLFNQSYVSANQLTFSVEPVIPKNQVDAQSGYFNIQLNSGQSQDLIIKYTNNSKKTITVNSAISSAKTNTNGVVDYNAPNIKNDPTLKYDISQLVTLPKSVSLEAGETKNVTVHVRMPEQEFKGLIAGGITFNDAVNDEANQSNKSNGMSISNIYSFQLGLLMRQSKWTTFSDDQVLTNGLKLKKVRAGQLNYRNVVYANLQNPLPVYVNQMVVDGKIYKSGSLNTLYSTVKSSLQMAPNSNFDFPITLNSGEKMHPGKYHLRLTAYSLQDNNGQFKTNVVNNKIQSYKYRWVFDKNFIITGEQASQYNKADVTIKKNNWLFWMLIISSLLLLFALLMLLWFLRKRRDEKEVDIEEEIKDLNNELTTVIRTVTMKEYKILVKSGHSVRLIAEQR